MSIINIRAAFEEALLAMTPSIATALENLDFTPPTPDTPYQRAYLRLAKPDNSERGSSYIEVGYFHVNLMYPKFTGSGALAARGELLRTTFRRGTSLLKSGTMVLVQSTPEIVFGGVDGDRFTASVKIPFSAFIS